MFIGEYLNAYADTTYVPPGWDEWHDYLGYYVLCDTYRINENGQIDTYDRSQIHDTDLFADKAATFLQNTAGGAPFFMYLSTNAPHTPALAAKRHQGMFDDVALPNPPSFNEADVLDKPAWIGDTPSLTPEEVSKLGQRYRQRLRSLQSVDEMVGKLVGVLSETGELSNTYIVFTSENGLHLSEHRLFAMKWTAYEEAVHISPLLVRGPGVPRGVSRSQMELNNDLAPTFASWEGLDAAELCGRTLAQFTPFYEPSDLLEKHPAGRALAAPYSAPVHEYAHGSTDTTGCSITGGSFYNPTTVQFPSAYVGDYFFADLCSGWIRTYDPSTGAASGFATGLEMPIDLEVSRAGQLYYLTRGSPASVGKIGYAAN